MDVDHDSTDTGDVVRWQSSQSSCAALQALLAQSSRSSNAQNSGATILLAYFFLSADRPNRPPSHHMGHPRSISHRNTRCNRSGRATTNDETEIPTSEPTQPSSDQSPSIDLPRRATIQRGPFNPHRSHSRRIRQSRRERPPQNPLSHPPSHRRSRRRCRLRSYQTQIQSQQQQHHEFQ